MQFKRILIALAAGAAVATTGFASASVLGVDAGTIQYGSGKVTCDGNGVDLNYGLETEDNTVRNIRVVDIDPLCDGATLFMKVDWGTVRQAVISGGTANVVFPAPYLNPANINDVAIWIEG